MRERKFIREFIRERTTPSCPTCKGSMDEAKLVLGDLTLCYRLPAPPALRADGYADMSMPEVNGGPFVDCPHCAARSHLSIWAEHSWQLTPVRTDADRRFLGEDLGERKP